MAVNNLGAIICWDDIHASVVMTKRISPLLMNAIVFDGYPRPLSELIAPDAEAQGEAISELLLKGLASTQFERISHA